jgi:hypothetical protein
MQNLTDNEKAILEIIREIKPFETVEIRKDHNGVADSYIVRREQKVHFTRLYQTKLSTS